MDDAQSSPLRHLLVIEEGESRRALILDAATYSLGRDPKSSIPLHARSVSWEHALLLRVPSESGYRYRVLDGNAEGKPSTNGIRLNGLPCTSEELEDGDLVEFGPEVKARYYRRQLSEEEISQYAESLEYRSVKDSSPKTQGTILFGDQRDRVLVIRAQEYQRVGVLRPGIRRPVLGLIFQDRCYFLEEPLGSDLEKAMEYCRERLQHPLDKREFCLLVQGDRGYRLAIHQPQLLAVPYDRFLAITCEQMRQSIRVQDRWQGLRRFSKCFLGSEAVTWLAGHFQISRSEAVQIGQECLQQGLFSHVLNKQDFADKDYYYRFRKDGGPEKPLLG